MSEASKTVRETSTKDANRDKEKIYYKDFYFTVTATRLQTPKRSVQLEYVESISMHQGHMGLFVVAALIIISVRAAIPWYFYDYEHWLIIFSIVLIGLLAYRIGSLKLQSRTASEQPYVWDVGVLRKVRAAIHHAMDDQRLSHDTKGEALDLAAHSRRDTQSSVIIQ